MPLYGSTGKAALLNAGTSKNVFYNDPAIQGSKSLALQLERQKASSYPWGAAFQIAFSGNPSTFQVDIEGAEDDVESNYVQIATITSLNSSNVGRWDMAGSVQKYPLFVRFNLSSVTNTGLTMTGKITR